MARLFTLILLLLTSCGTPILGDVHTPLGIDVISNGYNPNIEILDRKYLAMMKCAGVEDPETYLHDFTVEIISDGFYYTCVGDPEKKCYGEYNSGRSIIFVTEDLYAFGHELGHFLDYAIYGIDCVLTGSRDDRHVGSLAAACGDVVDGDKTVSAIPVR